LITSKSLMIEVVLRRTHVRTWLMAGCSDVRYTA